MYNNSDNEPVYRTLSEIRLRQAQLLADIAKESNQITNLWDNVFHNPRKSSTPTKKISSLMTTGVGVADTVILGWKLYRRFSGKPSLFSFFGKKRGKR